MKLLVSTVIGFVLSSICYILAFWIEPPSGRIGFFQLFETVLSWPVSKLLGDFNTGKLWPMAFGLILFGTVLFTPVIYLGSLILGTLGKRKESSGSS
ncbi:MAG: hypothetical protein HZB24_06565 [Desulfobacterales bacterium]|nr:hypothetical protein [Desulfobacterales bacterium]